MSFLTQLWVPSAGHPQGLQDPYSKKSEPLPDINAVCVYVCVLFECVLLMFRLYTEIKSEHSPKGCLCFKRCFVSKTKRKEGQTRETEM